MFSNGTVWNEIKTSFATYKTNGFVPGPQSPLHASYWPFKKTCKGAPGEADAQVVNLLLHGQTHTVPVFRGKGSVRLMCKPQI